MKNSIKIIDWLVFMLLGILAVISFIGSVTNYRDEKTAWAVEQQQIPNHPTFTLCFGLSGVAKFAQWPLTLGKDFDLRFSVSSDDHKKR